MFMATVPLRKWLFDYLYDFIHLKFSFRCACSFNYGICIPYTFYKHLKTLSPEFGWEHHWVGGILEGCYIGPLNDWITIWVLCIARPTYSLFRFLPLTPNHLRSHLWIPGNHLCNLNSNWNETSSQQETRSSEDIGNQQTRIEPQTHQWWVNDVLWKERPLTFFDTKKQMLLGHCTDKKEILEKDLSIHRYFYNALLGYTRSL